MRSAIVAAAFAAGAIAVPYKRDVVTDVDVVTATVYETVWADETPTTSAAPAPPATTTTTTAAAVTTQQAHYGHHHSAWTSVWSSATTWTVAASSQAPASSAAPAPSSEAPAPSSYQAPAPSSYAAPSSSAAPAPSSYAAPSSSAAPSSYAAPSSAASSAPAASATDYNSIVTYHHNAHRSNHSSPDIAWDDGLASTAQKIAETCVYAHNVEMDGGGYGQNIAAGVPADNVSAVITDLFYNGEINYFDSCYNNEYPSDDLFEKWGHFSQIVWKATTKVGCATVDCSSKGLANVGSLVSPHFTVCNYANPGNVNGTYADNVGSPLGHATIDWNAGL